jgi:hypothetical protein
MHAWLYFAGRGNRSHRSVPSMAPELASAILRSGAEQGERAAGQLGCDAEGFGRRQTTAELTRQQQIAAANHEPEHAHVLVPDAHAPVGADAALLERQAPQLRNGARLRGRRHDLPVQSAGVGHIAHHTTAQHSKARHSAAQHTTA